MDIILQSKQLCRKKNTFNRHSAAVERLYSISRVDTMFMMSKTAERQTQANSSLYIGPMAYDLYFNSTEHKGEFNVITLLMT